jgi:hypothetical protein
MERCAFCKAEDTSLYERGVPICINCVNKREGIAPAQTVPVVRDHKAAPLATTDQEIRGILLQDVLALTARMNEATKDFSEALRQSQGELEHPDGVQRVRNASHELSAVHNDLIQAHNRLDDYFSRGIVPDDIKRSG